MGVTNTATPSDDRKPATRRISRQEKLFQAKFESLELFVRVIAHDLNGPLTGMNLTVQAARKLAKSAAMHKLLDSLAHDLTSATDLLEELKSLNRREIFRTTRLDIGAEIKNLVDQIHANPRLPIGIELTESDAKLPVAGDISRLRRAWQNIIGNVFDLADQRKADEKIKLAITVKKTGKFARLRFTDNGGGIPRNRLPRVFEPFYTTKGEKNRGLGLFIARKIVVEHNGKIRVISSKPFTTVTIDLPLIK